MAELITEPGERNRNKLRRKWEHIQLASLSILLLRIFLALLPHAFALPDLQTLPWEFLLLIHVGGFVFSAGISFRAQLCSDIELATTDMDGFNPGLFSYTVWKCNEDCTFYSATVIDSSIPNTFPETLSPWCYFQERFGSLPLPSHLADLTVFWLCSIISTYFQNTIS